MSSQELLARAKTGDKSALKMLVDRAYVKQGISVKSIENNQGNLQIVLRSMKGTIPEKTLSSISLKTEKLEIESVTSVSVSQYVNDLKTVKNTHLEEKISGGNRQKAKIQKQAIDFISTLTSKHYAALFGLFILLPAMFMYVSMGRVCKTLDNKVAFEEFDQILEEWNDAVKLASSTSRMNLSNQIGQLQSIKRETENADWSECSQGAATFLVQSMDKKIEAFILFLDSDISESMIQSKMSESDELLFSYQEEYMNLLPPKQRRVEETEQSQTTAKSSLFLLALDQISNYEREGKLETNTEVLLTDSVLSGLEETYQLEVLESDQEQLVIVANAIQRGLKSYVLGVLGTEYVICESNEAVQSIAAPIVGLDTLTCGDDSLESMSSNLDRQ